MPCSTGTELWTHQRLAAVKELPSGATLPERRGEERAHQVAILSIDSTYLFLTEQNMLTTQLITAVDSAIGGTQPFVHALPRYLGAREEKTTRAHGLFTFLKILGSATRIYPESQVPCGVSSIL